MPPKTLRYTPRPAEDTKLESGLYTSPIERPRRHRPSSAPPPSRRESSSSSRVPDNIKAASCINTIQLVKETLGSDYDFVVSELPESTRAILDRRLLAVEWVPLAEWTPFVGAVLTFLGREPDIMRAFARRMCERDFSTVYRVFLRSTSPNEVIARIDSVWSAYFDASRIKVIDLKGDFPARCRTELEAGERRHLVLELDGFAPKPVFVHMLHGYIEQLLTMAGAKMLRVALASHGVQAGRLSARYEVDYA